jgi:predicted RNA-binding protein YlqC (UPF0109 family)
MNNSIDQQFVEFVVKSLVSKPDAVRVERRIDEKGVLLELSVDPEDLGRVIGKHGATAQSLRTLLRALGTKNDARYNLKIIDNGEGGPRQHGEGDGKQATVAEPATEASGSEPIEAQQEEAAPANDRLAQTRRELEDLDDLDV